MKLMTSVELRLYLDISDVTLFRLRQSGMPCFRVGRSFRYRMEDVMAWLCEQEEKQEKSAKA